MKTNCIKENALNYTIQQHHTVGLRVGWDEIAIPGRDGDQGTDLRGNICTYIRS